MALGSLPGADLDMPWLPAARDEVARYGYGRLSGLDDAGYPTNAYADSLSWAKSGVPVDEWSPAEQTNNATFEALNEAEQQEFIAVLEICGGDRKLREDHPDVPTKHALASYADYIGDEYPGTDGSLDWLYEYEPLSQSMFAVYLDREAYLHRDRDINLDLEAMQASGSLYTDPAVVELTTAWTTCMVDAGVVPESENLELRRQVGLGLGAVSSWARDPATGRIDGEKYLAVALADFDCRAQTDYVNTLAQRQAEREAAVVAAHQTELDTLVTTWNKLKDR